MSRRPSHHRRRPGRRPPHGYQGPGPPRPAGFTGLGFGRAWDRLLPGLQGADKRRHFNEVSGGITLAAAICGLLLGLACLGPFGAILGLGAGIAAGESFAKSNRFYRD